jgi:CheY-like chemotaxis protein
MHSILLVDDEPDLLTVWQMLLESKQYKVRCARNGEEALRMIDASTPDLVITDWMMPMMDGVELCRRLRERPDLAHIPVLIHTAADTSLRTEVNALWDDCIRKPAPIELLVTTIERLCAKR